MPAALVFAAIEVAAAVGFLSTGTAVLAQIGIVFGVVQQRRAERKARDSYNASLKDRLVNIAVTDAPRSRLYGHVRNSDGVIFKATRGDKSQYYTILVAVAGHEVADIPVVYFNDQPLTLDAQGFVLDAPWSGEKVNPSGFWTAPLLSGEAAIVLVAGAGSVTLPYTPEAGTVFVGVGAQRWPATVSGATVSVSGAGYSGAATVYYQFRPGSGQNSKARVRKYLGGPGQDLYPSLAADFPGLITAEHRFAGMALLRVDLEYDQDAFPSGVPTVTAQVLGAKVYDPRTGVTAWSNNPALCARDWALYAQGCAAEVSDIDDASFIAAANACDVSHNFTVTNQLGETVVSPQPMYTCGVVARTDLDPLETLDQIVAAMAGRRAFCGGVLRVRAGAYRPPVTTITESWCSDKGDIELVSTVPRTELFNIVRPTIADSYQQWVVVPVNEVRATAYIEADGAELPLELTLAAVTDVEHAQHVCGVMLREARQAVTLKLPCKLNALPLEVFDCVSVTLPRFGFNAKLFEVLGWEFTLEGGVLLTLRETDASIFDPDAEFTRTDPAPNTALPDPFRVRQLVLDAPASGTAQLLRQADGTIVSRIRVSWPAVQDESVVNGGAVDVRYRLLGGPWQTVSVPGADTVALLEGVLDGGHYLIQARARNRLTAGAWSVQMVHQVVGKTEAPAAVAGLVAAVIPGAVRISWTPSAEADYAKTELRVGATWAGGTALKLDGPASSYDWLWPALGSYTVWAAHVDTSGNVGSPVSVAVTVDSSLYIGVENTTLLPIINAARGTNLFTGSLATPYGVHLDASISSVGHPDAYGTNNAVNVTLPVSGAYLYWRLTGLQPGYYSVHLKLLVVAGMSIVVGTTDGATWSGSGKAIASTGSSSPVWVQVSLRQLVTSGGVLDLAVGASYDLPNEFSAPVPVTVSISDLWIEREGAGATKAVTDAATAKGVADGAANNASSALSTLATMRSNGYIDASEKPALMRQWQAISDERMGIYAQGTTYGLTSLRDAYDSAFVALANYLTALSPAWSDTTSDTPITPATDQAVWAAYYSARQTLLNAIADEAAKRAQWSQVSGSGKPADNATRNYTYRQSGDPAVSPGGVVDGELWLDTGTGKAWQRVSGAWQPYVGTGSVGTGELANDAATEVTQDTYSFGGASSPGVPTVQRSFTVTPSVACKVNFTAVMGAGSVNPDGGNYLYWAVSIGGAADTVLGNAYGSGGGKRTYACAVSFAASAGVSLEFKLITDRNPLNPAITLFDSSMRVEVIKR